MARPVKTNEVSQLIVRHEKMNRGLMSIASACENLYNEISTTAERYVANEAVSKLREIPVEEINRNKSGFLIKA